MSEDDPPGRNDPLMSVHSTDTPSLSENDTGSRWFALLIIGLFLGVGLLGVVLELGLMGLAIVGGLLGLVIVVGLLGHVRK